MYDVKCEHDQVWFRLKCAPGFKFGAVYICPSDSPYYDTNSFAIFQKHNILREYKTLAIGDINARIPDLTQFNSPHEGIRYSENIDKGKNSNGKRFSDVLHTCDMKPINHMNIDEKSFIGDLTFRKKKSYISQVDWAVVTPDAVDHVLDFSILQSSSLPTDHAAISVKLGNFKESAESLKMRAQDLGVSYQAKPSSTRPPLKLKSINIPAFTQSLPDPEELWINETNSDNLSDQITSSLYTTAKACKLEPPPHNPANPSTPQNSNDRWRKLLSLNDPKEVWKSIDWNGNFSEPVHQSETPSDELFCQHYEKLLNPDIPPNERDPPLPNPPIYVPILDDPITPDEVDDQLKKLKTSKAAGPDGVPPGLLKYLPAAWILLLTFLYNLVFSEAYPFQWALSKVSNIFKKGKRTDPGNYRGIAVMSALAKLYDMILSARFQKWYQPSEEQAGAQPGRGCEEQILILRLIIEIARRTNKRLYIVFVDYQKAYDKVKRSKLYQMLIDKGCGSTFLNALIKSVASCSGIVGNKKFSTSAGVRQGASSSCPLFTFFIDATVAAISAVGPDGWLEDLHCLLQMDDTCIFATSRDMMMRKLRCLKNCTDDLGMLWHPTKSKFIVINDTDLSPFILDEVIISHILQYIYLGTVISMSPIHMQVQAHIREKASNVMKFHTFLSKNTDAPYHVKRHVWDCALVSSIFYSSETWLTNDLSSPETAYMSTLKHLLGVRNTTCKPLVLLEAGACDAKSFIREKQRKFFLRLTSRLNYTQSYAKRIIDLAIEKRTPAGKIIQSLLQHGDYISPSVENLALNVNSNPTSRRLLYLSVNPSLSKCCVYDRNVFVPEHMRISFTRLRVSSHRLRSETGRWSRIPMAERKCPCGVIQSEEHVLLTCPLTAELRESNPTLPFHSLSELLCPTPENCFIVCKFCHDVLNTEELYE